MAKNMAVPNMIILNGRKIMGNRSIMLNISGLVAGAFWCGANNSELWFRQLDLLS